VRRTRWISALLVFSLIARMKRKKKMGEESRGEGTRIADPSSSTAR
jgi:hypothetical protein